MRTLILVITALVFAAPAIAADYSAKPVLTKGTKSYQSRTAVPSEDSQVQSIEPAAGAEVSGEDSLQQGLQQYVAPSVTSKDDPKTTPIKLHGKK